MRLAKRTQCPNCRKKWAVQSLGFLGEYEIFACRFCDWMPSADRRELERVRREAQTVAMGGSKP